MRFSRNRGYRDNAGNKALAPEPPSEQAPPLALPILTPLAVVVSGYLSIGDLGGMLIQAGQVPEHVLRCVSLPGEQQLLPGLCLCKAKAPNDSAAEGGLVRGVEMEDFFN